MDNINFDPTDDSTVQYGNHGDDLTNTANGNMVKFVDDGSKHTVRSRLTVVSRGAKKKQAYATNQCVIYR